MQDHTGSGVPPVEKNDWRQRLGASRYRTWGLLHGGEGNRRIGEFLKELDLTEGRFTGIPKILKVLKENGSPPEFETDEDRTSFLIRLPVHERAV